MYDITKKKQFSTVGELKELLKNIPDETQIVVTGDDYCWFHIEEDGSVICLDVEELDDAYVGLEQMNKGVDNMRVAITNFIDNDHRSHYWYGGQCVRIDHKGYTAVIEAIGDIYVEYAPNGRYQTHFKDKNNSGRFYDEMHYYIKNDNELYTAITNGELVFDHNNWWECSILDPQGNWHDLMWCLDADYLDDAIKEVKDGLDEMIQYIQDTHAPSSTNGDYSPGNPWDAPGMSIKDFI